MPSAVASSRRRGRNLQCIWLKACVPFKCWVGHRFTRLLIVVLLYIERDNVTTSIRIIVVMCIIQHLTTFWLFISMKKPDRFIAASVMSICNILIKTKCNWDFWVFRIFSNSFLTTPCRSEFRVPKEKYFKIYVCKDSKSSVVWVILCDVMH